MKLSTPTNSLNSATLQGEIIKFDCKISGFDRAQLDDGIGNRKKSANSLTLPASDNYTPD